MREPNILIVDDQFGIRVLLTEVLQKEGYETFQAANGPQALSLAANHEIDLVLLDMKIPGMDGIENFKKAERNETGYPGHHYDRLRRTGLD
ncbi:UNVERIFIED_ORG: CheY-like chemotaxis protein [Heyndrickxia coagulans]